MRSMITFMNERINIETRYANALHALAKTGGVSGVDKLTTATIIDTKNYEEQTVRDAINSLINFTIQESELHKEFAIQTKSNIVQALDDTRKELSKNKKGWTEKLDSLKKQITTANEASKREHQRLTQQVAIVEDLKKKRDEQYLKFGLSVDDQIRLENMPPLLQQVEKKYQDAVQKLAECRKTSATQQEVTEKCVADFNRGSQEILEHIEKQEYIRLDVLKAGLANFSLVVSNMVQQNESLYKLLDMELAGVDPVKDLQAFIHKHSTFADNERLRNLYKELGLF